MKHSIITIMVTILLSEHVMAWDFTSPVGGRCSGMGYTSVAMSDFWSIHNNPAGMAEWRHISAGFYYENRFLMKELGYKNAAFLIPLDIGVIGLSVRQFGFTHYNENKIGIAFARSFGKSLRIGIQLDYLLFAFSKDYKKYHTATFEAGLSYDITEKLCVAAYLFNPVLTKIKSLNKDKLPIIMRAGLLYNLTDDFSISTEIEEDFEANFKLRFGIEYKAYKNLYLRCGIQSNPWIICFGTGYSFRNITIDISSNMHCQLGVSLQSSIIFNIKSRS